jgi:hypothetical protein
MRPREALSTAVLSELRLLASKVSGFEALLGRSPATLSFPSRGLRHCGTLALFRIRCRFRLLLDFTRFQDEFAFAFDFSISSTGEWCVMKTRESKPTSNAGMVKYSKFFH